MTSPVGETRPERPTPSRLRVWLKKVQAAAIGVLAAIATVFVIDHWRQDSRVTVATPEDDGRGAETSHGRFVRTVVVDKGAMDRIGELERQLRELQAKAAKNPEDKQRPDEAEILRKVEEAYARLNQAHDRDVPDPKWAPTATKQFMSGLTALSTELGFSVGPADCKTTTCRATVSWRDYASARSTGVQLVERVFPGLNCTQKIRLAAPGDPSAPYSTQLFFDCADLRAGLAEEIAAAQ
jgi:hypothetical protein